MTNWRFNEDLKWGDLLERVHHGETTRGDMAVINLRVVSPNLASSHFTVKHETMQLSNPYIFGDEWHT
jgi:hypothetical protein